MLLFDKRRSNSGISEDDMEIDIIEWLKEYWVDEQMTIWRQIHDVRVGRISDIVILKGAQLINIECKLDDVGGVLNQAKDHLKWAHYSYIAMPTTAWISPDWCKLMIEHGIGLFLWDHKVKTLVEAIYGKYQRIDKINKRLNKNKIAGIKRVYVEIQAEELKKNQININYEKI